MTGRRRVGFGEEGRSVRGGGLPRLERRVGNNRVPDAGTQVRDLRPHIGRGAGALGLASQLGRRECMRGCNLATTPKACQIINHSVAESQRAGGGNDVEGVVGSRQLDVHITRNVTIPVLCRTTAADGRTNRRTFRQWPRQASVGGCGGTRRALRGPRGWCGRSGTARFSARKP